MPPLLRRQRHRAKDGATQHTCIEPSTDRRSRQGRQIRQPRRLRGRQLTSDHERAQAVAQRERTHRDEKAREGGRASGAVSSGAVPSGAVPSGAVPSGAVPSNEQPRVDAS